ncbi:MAG: DUF5054 domain-containing protein, partial [Acidimicrobiia bacterium]|nr:DUF5054 domain-containing protein [Acidimicrobiia bacterium]
MDDDPPSRVLVVCKTHLDVGFTDLAATVLDDYLGRHLPAALDTADDLRRHDDTVRLTWTVGSWLVTEALERSDRLGRRQIERAIDAGDLAWHAWPFTTHTGLLDPTLATDALGLSARLDERFGRRTTAAKMTDVPGHPRALVPVLADGGVTFLHVGVNPASRPPDVPHLFRWVDRRSGRWLHVAYQHGGYGGAVRLDRYTMLVVAHTGDNLGPPAAPEVRHLWARLAAEYPTARIEAATLDDAARVLAARAADDGPLPEVSAEIGDTWIHGAATDPTKLARARALQRVRAAMRADGRLDADDGAGERATRALLLVAEHTWGLDQKTHLPDTTTWTSTAVDRARHHDDRWRRFEASWAEQRAYVDAAAEALRHAGLSSAVDQALAATVVERVTLDTVREDLAPHDPSVPLVGRHATVRVDGATGALDMLVTSDGRVLADLDHLLAVVGYQTFDVADYERWWDCYVVAESADEWWARADQTKPGLESADPPPVAGWWPFTVTDVRSGALRADESGQRLVVWLAGHPDAVDRWGCPREVVLSYGLPDDRAEVEIDLVWLDKAATRYPEALWWSFSPRGVDPRRWRLDVLGAPLDPANVVRAGGRHLHAVGRGA